MKTCDIMLYLRVFLHLPFLQIFLSKLVKNFSYKREREHRIGYVERVRKTKINDLNKSSAMLQY